MRSSLRRVAATTVAVFSCALVLAACGGGGGGGSAPATPPVSTQPVQPAAPKSTVRATMQSAFYTFANANGGSISSTTVFGAARRVQAMHRGRRPLSAAPVCGNGHASTGPVSNPDGSQTYTDYYYYEAACVHLRELDITTLTQNSVSAFAATVTSTTYDVSGGVTGYTTSTIQGSTSAGQDTFTVTATLAKAPGAAWYAKLGTTCTGPSTGSSLHCGLAAVGTVNGTQTGASVNQSSSFTTSGATTTATISVTASAYSAPSGLDITAGAIPVWNVTGAPPLDTVTGTTTVSFTGSTLTSGSLSLADSATGISVSGTATSAGVTFALAQNGTQLATATVDPAGNGSVRYADGTTETVTNWTISG